MGGAQGSNVAVRSPDGTNSLIGRPCLLTDRRRNRTNRAGAGCSWLGRRSAGAYARTLRTPTLLKRAKPCAPPTFSSLPLPPTFHLVYRTQRRIVYVACVVRFVETRGQYILIGHILFAISVACFFHCERDGEKGIFFDNFNFLV